MNALSIFRWRKKVSRSNIIGQWPDDREIVKFGQSPEDVFTLGDAKQGICIFGENGSGKTSGSGHLFARKYLEQGFGGLVLCFKAGKNERDDEAKLWRSYLREAGRERDGRFFAADAPYRFNFLDYESRTSGVDFAENLVSLLTDIASINHRSDSTSADATYWSAQKKKLLRNAIGLLLLAEEPIQLRTLYRMITQAPMTIDQSKSEEWRSSSMVFELLARASHKNGKHPEYGLIKDYYLHEWPMLADKTKATIDSDFTGMFDPLTRGKIGEMFGTTTNLSPDDIFNGKVVVIDIPVSKYREIGQYCALIWAQLFQRAVDRRNYESPSTRPVFLWEDEAHYFTIEQDALFQTTARSKGICVVRLTQNLPNYLDAYGRDGKNKVDTLLGNHVLKIFHRNGDPTTNKWASEVIAKEFKVKHSLSMNGSSTEKAKISASVSEEYVDSCPPHEFVGLINGGERNNGIVEGIVFQSGRLWQTTKRWTKMRFRQTG